MESIYKALMQRRRAANLVRRESQKSPCPIVSVGNLTTGGTGKTPAVQWLARALQNQGLEVGIAARGYGGTLSGAGALVSAEKRPLLTAIQAGDEAVLHARNLPGARVAIAKDRRRAVEICVENGASVVLLDDGFQFWSLPRAFDLVLLDAKNPWGNGHLLPRGRLREERAALRRADAILLTRCERALETQIRQSITEIEAWTSAPIYRSNHAPRDLRDEKSGEIVALKWISGRGVQAFAGLANNAQFYGALEKLGAQKIERLQRERGDHHRWKPADFLWRGASSGAWRNQKSEPIATVTTEKDAVKLDPNWFDGPLYSLRIELEIEDEAGLLLLILSQLSRP